jgi:hypothetical protein
MKMEGQGKAAVTSSGNSEAKSLSILESALADGVEKEKCVVAQYRTTIEQKIILDQHMQSNKDSDELPVEWVIDIADESNGWFYGTAYGFNNKTNYIHVMVPDKHSPTFDGRVLLDYRTVHLVECVDEKTDALFNKIIRDSVIKVRWEVEWFEEGEGGDKQVEADADAVTGKWMLTTARYFIRIANQLLVEDEGFGQDNKGFVMLTADLNVRLQWCHKAKGADDFARLIRDGLVQSTPDALDSTEAQDEGKARSRSEKKGVPGGNDRHPSRKVAEMSRSLKECLSDVLDDRERLNSERKKFGTMFKAFSLMGDLDSGLKLLSFIEESENGSDQDALDHTADESWYLCQKIEKNAINMLKSNEETNPYAEENESLRKMTAAMKKELEELRSTTDILLSGGDDV